MGFLNDLLLTLINALYSVVNNYALTIILFTILIKVCVSPLNLKSRRFERLQGVKLADMISDRAILAAVNQELNQIAK